MHLSVSHSLWLIIHMSHNLRLCFRNCTNSRWESRRKISKFNIANKHYSTDFGKICKLDWSNKSQSFKPDFTRGRFVRHGPEKSDGNCQIKHFPCERDFSETFKVISSTISTTASGLSTTISTADKLITSITSLGTFSKPELCTQNCTTCLLPRKCTFSNLET